MDSSSCDGIVDTYAGNGSVGSSNGPRLDSSFSSFWSCCIAPNGGVFIGDFSNHMIRLVNAEGLVSTFAGTGGAGFSSGPRLTSSFHSPSGLCLTFTNELLISDKNNNRIRLINAQDNVITIAGSGQTGSDDGPASTATFRNPVGVVECSMGILVADWSNHKLRLIADGVVSTYAGTGHEGHLNGPRLFATFFQPVGVCVNRVGDIFVADRNNHRIRVIRSGNGEVQDFSGNGERGFQDGSAKDSRFTFPWALCMTPFGELLVADEFNHRIRLISNNGTASTLAGNGEKDFRDGNRESASFNYPACICISPQGEVFVADRDNYRLRRIRMDKWAIDEVVKYKKLSLAGLREAENLSDMTLKLHENASWKLHSPIIVMRCPQLLEEPMQQKMRDLNISIDTINGLLDYIYDNHLPKLSVTQLCELDVCEALTDV
jgi:hypothetical protein